MCLYLHISNLNRVAPPFAARPNLGSQTSCRTCELKNKIKKYSPI